MKPMAARSTAAGMNPWLSIPLADYEGHMSLPEVAQSAALASEFEDLLQARRPTSVALLGCAGGNGLERVDATVTRRIVALDINPAYVEATCSRFDGRFHELETFVSDIAEMELAPFRPVQLIFAGLLLEYVPLAPALRFIRSGLETGGTFGCVIQLESDSAPVISPSPFTSLAVLSGHIHTRTPQQVVDAAVLGKMRWMASRTLRMPNRKVLVSQVYAAE
jgi:SAM-dependent methyltransferase